MVMRASGAYEVNTAHALMEFAPQKPLRFIGDTLAFGIQWQQAKIVPACAVQYFGNFFKHAASESKSALEHVS
jgi:hypothetical protein